MPESLNNEHIRRKTVKVPYDSVQEEPRIEMAQEPYYLSEVEYVHLKNVDSKALIVGIAIFLTSIGYLFVLLTKLFTIYVINSQTITIEDWEWYVVLIAAIFGLIIFILCKWIFPSEKSKVMKEIKEHFKRTRPARQYPRRR